MTHPKKSSSGNFEEVNNTLPQLTIKVKKLPSKSIPYPDNARIQYRPYTFGELRLIATSRMDEKSSMEFVLKGIQTNFPKEDLTMSDLIYLGLMRKLSTFNDIQFRVNYTCAKCKKKTYGKFTKDDMEFSDIQADSLPAMADLSDGNKYEFMPLTVGGYFALFDNNLHHDPTAMSATLCSNVEFKKFFEYLNNSVDYEDTEIMDEVEKVLDHGLKPIESTCKWKGCDKKMHLALERRQGLIMPFRKGKKSKSTRVYFGKGDVDISTSSGEDGIHESEGASH
jgi:hypothetical protein